MSDMSSLVTSLSPSQAANGVRQGLERADPLLSTRVESTPVFGGESYRVIGEYGGSKVTVNILEMRNGNTKIEIHWSGGHTPDYRQRVIRAIEREIPIGDRPPFRG